MSEELKPCPVPWCESDVLEPVRSIWSHNYSIICQECRAQGPSLATKADAIDAWNTRAPDARLAAAEAERDAAVAELTLGNVMPGWRSLDDTFAAIEASVAQHDLARLEGERRATAAIVADLRTFISSDRAKYFADRYKAGEHLKGTSNE